MKLKDSNTWLIIALILTTLVGPGVVWEVQKKKQEEIKIGLEKEKFEIQKTIDNLKVGIEEDKLKIQKNAQLIDMYTKLSKLMDEQRALYDQHEATTNSFQMQRARLRMDEKYQEIDSVKEIIAELSGKQPEEIKGGLPPFKPRNLRIIQN